MSEAAKLQQLGLAVVATEARAIADLKKSVDGNFSRACELLLSCQGRIVVIGMGKSGHIGGKIAATLASTGSPAFFVHPGEASHGDLGMITAKDVVLALSNSGETAEILTILPIIKRLDVPLITLTGNPKATLALAATTNIDVSVKEEACPLGLAPTSSTTATLVMGDALAVALLESRGFTTEDFARSHPAGALGRRLLLLIDDVMHTDDAIPKVASTATLGEALMEMTSKRLGMAVIVDTSDKLLGLFTDGDLRRTLEGQVDIKNCAVTEVMSPSPTTVQRHLLAAEALQIMQQKRINGLVVVDDHNHVVGTFNMHDLLRAGVV